ncbi:hypothetical protein SCLCIDRAFT_131860 [Scleroderma citrinum Foug A]|uniref:Uncharacterized protein n=1 Tax=Scleroderma citrinum Foug A TaxID=1036808 RepID=A0A0C2Z440_9AGAM|nr:hypothetical protein SCLCIDRAFT_131860 [Scleroderma citrinum Foug A]
MNRDRGQSKLNGIIYTHRITDNRLSGSVCKNLDMFGRLCGDRAAERVCLVTAMWYKARDHGMAKNRLAQLESNFWNLLIAPEARHENFDNNATSAWDIVSDRGRLALLQEELVGVEKKLNETTAGKALHTSRSLFRSKRRQSRCFRTKLRRTKIQR